MRATKVFIFATCLSTATATEPCTNLSAQQLLSLRGKVTALRHLALLFELFLPVNWDPSHTHPVITFLHGRGESGGFDVTNAQSLPLQLISNASAIATFPFIVVIPQCPVNCMRYNSWLPSVLQDVTALLHEWVCASAGGDPRRLYLAGQSMGGHGAYVFAAQQARLFAALVVVCGYAQGDDEAAAIASRLSRQKMPVLIYHSVDDSVIPVDAADQMVAALHRGGYRTDEAQGADDENGPRVPRIKYVRYDHAPGPPMPAFSHLIGHGSYELAFRDAELYRWLLRQQCARCSKPRAPWSSLREA